jgi:hypothetical protein
MYEIPGIIGMCVMAKKCETRGTEEVMTEKAGIEAMTGTEDLTALTGTEVVALTETGDLTVSETEDQVV